MVEEQLKKYSHCPDGTVFDEVILSVCFATWAQAAAILQRFMVYVGFIEEG
jgi:hypothetical protein